jgi:hypothetical protein
MTKSQAATSVPSGVARPAVVNNTAGGVLNTLAGSIETDPTSDYATTVQMQVAPRADMPGPWYIVNLGPNTLYYGPSGVTSGNGTSVAAGAKSAAIAPTNGFSTFVVTASGASTFQIVNH